MTRILITAFEPFGAWSTNSSQLCLETFRAQWAARSQGDGQPTIEFRTYPVDFRRVRQQIEADLQGEFDYAIHLGQAAESSTIRLERFALNVGHEPGQPSWRPMRLEPDGPAAYETALPLCDWAKQLRAAGLPAEVSFHAGTYLCNAIFYWSQFFSGRNRRGTQVAFLHLPLARGHTSDEPQRSGASFSASLPSATVSGDARTDARPTVGDHAGGHMGNHTQGPLTPEQTAQAVRLIVRQLVNRPPEQKSV